MALLFRAEVEETFEMCLERITEALDDLLVSSTVKASSAIPPSQLSRPNRPYTRQHSTSSWSECACHFGVRFVLAD